MKYVLGISCVLLLLQGRGKTCDIKPSGNSIDWKRMAGKTWYQLLNTNDTVDIVTPCYLMQFTSCDNGLFTFHMLDPSVEGQDDVVSGEFVQEGAFYRMNKNFESKWQETSSKEALKKDPKLMRSNTKELSDHFSLPIALYTDYENYFIGAMCDSDNHYIFAYLPRPNFTTKDLLMIFNKLSSTGNAVPVFLSGCHEIDGI